MINFENTEVFGWEAAIRGMRNPMNSWSKSDSGYCSEHISRKTLPCHICKNNRKECKKHLTNEDFIIGPNDLHLMKRLRKAGHDHAKYLRMISVTVDITAPIYWWKEFDTYKIGTVRNSCSTMHKIQAKEFTLDDFSHEHLYEDVLDNPFNKIIDCLNFFRDLYLQNKDKEDWWQMIQLLPSSYNQRATVQLNYEVLNNMYHSRKNHKLDEWHTLCKWIETLPYAEDLITSEKNTSCNHLQEPLIFVENLFNKGKSKWRCPKCNTIILRDYIENREARVNEDN